MSLLTPKSPPTVPGAAAIITYLLLTATVFSIMWQNRSHRQIWDPL